tara:strand:+ start:57 stop:596 length:540 start_codon:yes stop_codon:yes gene_type:complete
MRKWSTYFLTIGLTVFFSYSLTIKYLPNLIYETFHNRIKKNQNVNDNELKLYNLPTDLSREVVMPNPDFLYVISFYDLKNGPLNLTGKMPDSTYWSLSFYKSNTINWFVKNDLDFNNTNLNIVLTEKNNEIKLKEFDIIKSPNKKGFMIIRILIEKKDKKSIEYYKSVQKSISLKKLYN